MSSKSVFMKKKGFFVGSYEKKKIYAFRSMYVFAHPFMCKIHIDKTQIVRRKKIHRL